MWNQDPLRAAGAGTQPHRGTAERTRFCLLIPLVAVRAPVSNDINLCILKACLFSQPPFGGNQIAIAAVGGGLRATSMMPVNSAFSGTLCSSVLCSGWSLIVNWLFFLCELANLNDPAESCQVLLAKGFLTALMGQ